MFGRTWSAAPWREFTRGAGWLLATSLALAVSLGSPAPAGAFLKHFLVHPFGPGPASGNPIRAEHGKCPREHVPQAPLGGGGITLGGPPGGAELALNGLGPELTSAVASDPVAQPWQLAGQKFCTELTDAPPTAETAGPYLKSVITRTPPNDVVNSNPVKQALVFCGAGRSAIGGGFHILGDRDGVVGVQRVERFQDGLKVIAHELDPSDAPWALHPFVICADVTSVDTQTTYAGTPRPVIVSTLFGSPRTAGISAPCPPRYAVIGGAANVIGTDGRPVRKVVLRSSHPFDLGPRNRGWHGSAIEEDVQTAQWRLQVSARCAPLVPFGSPARRLAASSPAGHGLSAEPEGSEDRR